MKKIIISFIAMISIFIIGCSQDSSTKAESLEEAYFDITTKLEQTENLNAEYFGELLEGYNFKKHLTGFETVEYLFSDLDELLTISCNSDEELTEIRYSNVLNDNRITLSYELNDTPRKLRVFVETTEIPLNEEVSLLMDIDNLELLSGYNEISKNIQTINNLTAENVSEILSVKPVSTTSYDSTKTEHVFEKGDEKITLSYNETEKKIDIISYVKPSQEVAVSTEKIVQPEISKETLTSKYSGRDAILTSNTSLVNTLEIQMKALEILK